jgi:hypothetical protein
MGELPPGEAHRLAESLQRLRPLAKNIVDAEMSLAMERRVRVEIDLWLREQAERTDAARPAGTAEDPERAGDAARSPDTAQESGPSGR